MVRSLLTLLVAFVAVVIGFDQADQPTVIASTGPEVSVRLTQAETDCIVGGQAGCYTEAKQATAQCLYNDYMSDQLNTWGDVGECVLYGVWTGIGCAFNWFIDLF